MPSPMTPHLVALSLSGVLRQSTCWKITRTDGTVIALTDHDSPLVVGGVTYSPTNGMSSSARQKQQGTKAQNAEARGVVSSDLITEADLRAGKYRDALIEEFVVDWRYPHAGQFARARFWIDSLAFTGDHWTANIAGAIGRLKRKIGRTYNRTCDANLGDSRCSFDRSSVTVSGSVSTIVEQRRVFTTGLTAARGYYNLGVLTWTSGANVGEISEVKNYVLAGGRVSLQLRTPFDIAASDAFTIWPGCDKTLATCKAKFNNVANFRGFPSMLGSDTLVKSPTNTGGG